MFEIREIPAEQMPEFRWAVWDTSKDRMVYRVASQPSAEKLITLLKRAADVTL